MTFSEAFARYRAGTASDGERRLVEEELEKNRLISEYLDEEWDASVLPEEISQTEMKKVRRNLCLRNAGIVLVSIVLCAALFLLGYYVVLPGLERQYWNPEENSLEGEFSNDLELTLAAYSELFVPGQSIGWVASTSTGFASYDLTVLHWDAFGHGDPIYTYGTLKKDVLTLPTELLLTIPMNIFENACYPPYPLDEESKGGFYEKLSSLPDYVRVEAAVSFAEDMDMEELIVFEESLEGGVIEWVGIRNCPQDRQWYPLCGIAPFVGGTIREGINDDYPYLEIKGEKRSAENLETHFQSLLRYSADRAAAGRGIGVDARYYEEVLAYIEEAGVHSYGCYLVAPPQVFLDLLDSGIASQVWPQEAIIDIG